MLLSEEFHEQVKRGQMASLRDFTFLFGSFSHSSVLQHKETRRSLNRLPRKFTVVQWKLEKRMPDSSLCCCRAEGNITPWKSAEVKL